MQEQYTSDEILRVSDLGVRFDDVVILENISFTVGRGQTLALVGPNGSGKSVLFRALLGLIPHDGTVHWHASAKIAYVPQTFSVERSLPFSVSEFFGLKRITHERVVELLELVGMGGDHQDPAHGRRHIKQHILPQSLGTLSGGQLQRLMIAWSLADEPDVLLFDEPTSGIDIGGQGSIYSLLKNIQQERALTILLISHDLDVVYGYADHVLCVSRHLVCHGPPKQALDQATLEKIYGGEVGFTGHEHVHEH